MITDTNLAAFRHPWIATDNGKPGGSVTLDANSPIDLPDDTGEEQTGGHDADPRGGQSGSVESFSLDDRYTREQGTIYLTGIQALVRMVRDRARLDRRQNLKTASFISGYEGSPLAGYDLEIARRGKYLSDYNIVHRPGLNEELAATSVMGSQVAAQVGTLSDGSTAWSATGTARPRASIAPPTRCATPT